MDSIQESKPMTVEEAIDLWLNVPKKPFKAHDLDLLKSAEHFNLPFKGIDLPVSSWGNAEGALVILVHGWGGHRGQLGAFVPMLIEAGYRVVAYDAPAHGESAGTHTNAFEMAAALQALIEMVGQPYAILAHSLGTMSVNVALQQGLTIEKLIFFGALRRLSDAIEPFVKMNNLSEGVEAQVRTAMELKFGEDVWEITSMDLQLPQFDIPALLFHDREDDVTPYISSAGIVRAWKSAKLITTKGLGHRRILRDAGVIQQVLAFLG